MDSSANLWQQSRSKIDLSGAKSTKDSSKVNYTDRNSGGRRSSDGGQPPFNRTRSFKTKQLVRSQAIRETQSPPRVPSPRSPDSKEIRLQSTGKIKSASVDLDDRPSYDNIASFTETLQTTVTNDENSFNKSCNLSYKNILVSESGDIKKLGANVIYSTDLLECKNNTGKKIISENMKRSEEVVKCNELKNSSHNNNDNLKCNRNIDNPVKNLSIAELDHSQLAESSGKNENKSDRAEKSTEDKENIGNTDIPKNKKIPLKELKNIASPSKFQNIDSTNSMKVEFQKVEIQVTSGDTGTTNLLPLDCVHDSNENRSEISSTMENTHEKDDVTENRFKTEGRRANHPSKQDSGVSCWDSCNCCGDLSPEIMMSDTEEENIKMKHNIGCPEHENQYDNPENFRNAEKNMTQRNGTMLSVQQSSSGGDQRLLHKQSSGGSMDSGQHSISSPLLSRDNSTEYMGPCEIPEIYDFIKETLNKSIKDRQIMLKLENEMTLFIKDPSRKEHKFPAYNSYSRLLIHRCAQLFGLRHGPDTMARSTVYIAKSPNAVTTNQLPQLCPLQQWCTKSFTPDISGSSSDNAQAKSILKRESLDEEPPTIPSVPPKLVQTPRSKSFEQREEEYVKARRRIFNSPGQFQAEDGKPSIYNETMVNESDAELYKPQILLPEHGKLGRLLKVQSLEHENVPATITRGVVSKAHSFGGYGGRQGLQHCDSITSINAPPQRILSRQGELASNSWRLSPCSSGYKTLSVRSDSITPSPTSTPYGANNNNKNISPGVLWAITDMSTVPPGAIIIHPQTGEALTNTDGTLYHFDPAKPLHSTLLPSNQAPMENIRVLSNPERRRSKLEKQRATISPGTESDNSSGDNKNHNSVNDVTNKPVCSESGDIQDLKNIHSKPSVDKLHVINSENRMLPDKTKEIPVTSNTNTKHSDSLAIYKSSFPTNASESAIVLHQAMERNNNHGEIRENEYNQSFINKETNDMNQLEYYDQEGAVEISNKYLEDRQLNNYALTSYTDIPVSNFYTQQNPPQYYSAYDENNQEVYVGHPQVMGYAMRPTDQLYPPGQQLPHPQMIYAAQPENPIGFTPANELCYPGGSAPMLIPQPQYRIQEPDVQQPYHLIPTTDQQQSVMVLGNKLTDSEVQPQIASFPIGYQPNMERPPIVGSSPTIVGVPAPHPTYPGYQFQGAPGWSCWPPVAVYAPNPTQPSVDDGSQKYQPQQGAYLAQHIPETASLNSVTVPTIPQHFFPHPGMVQPQPNQYYTPYQPAHLLQQPYPYYQPYNHGRSSVISQEGCSTPGFQTHDNNFQKPLEPFVPENFTKNQSNAKSPKSANSRGASNSGSSRATPISNNIPVQNINEINFANIDPSYNGNYQFLQPSISYVPFAYPYQPALENLHPNFEDIHYSNQKPKTDNANVPKFNPNYPDKNYTNRVFQQTNSSPSETQNIENPTENQREPGIIILQNINNTQQNKKPPENSSFQNNVPEFDSTKKPPPIPTSTAVLNEKDSASKPPENKKIYYEKKNPEFQKEERFYKNNPPKNPIFNSIHRKSFPSWDIQDIPDYQRNEIQISLMKQLSLNDNYLDSAKLDTKPPWRKNYNYNQRDYHNFPKNLNKRFSNMQYDKDKVPYQNRSTYQNFNQRPKSQPLFDTPPVQVTPTSVNAPSIPWNAPPGLNNICNNPNKIGSPTVISTNNNQERSTNDSFLSGNNHYGKNKMNTIDVCVVAAAQQRYIDAMTLPIAQNSIYHRNQTLQTYANGGLGLMQTPPLAGQSTFLLRQVPSWLRRPPAPVLFGPPPPGQIRGKQPRHHQYHNRNYYHN